VPGIQGLSFVDDLAWWAEGKSERELARRLSNAADATLDWARENGVAFDKAKIEATFFQSGGRNLRESVRVGDYEVQFNQHATR